MKKMFFILLAVMSFASIEAFAQEVRGVETKLVIYNGPQYKGQDGPSYERGTKYYYSTNWFGFSFYNMNTIPVSVDAVLYYEGNIVDSKSFVLKSKESYIWKQEDRASFQVNVYSSFSVDNRWIEDGKISPGNFRVEYKAFKLQ